MGTGKLKNEDLKTIVLDEIRHIRDDILVGPNVGEDCSAIDFGDLACVVTTDPITGATDEIGKLAVNINLNDIASSGAEPVALLVTLLCPDGTTQSDINHMMKQVNETANALGVQVIGGHTEITSAVNRVIVSATAIGKVRKENMIKTAGAKAGDNIYITKYPALEGTAIIVNEKKSELKGILTNSEVSEAMGYFDSLSVLKEGEIGAKIGASSMHDITEGGVLGAVHELCDATGLGCKIYHNKIELKETTEKVCEHFLIEPLRLISSGSMMITVSDDRVVDLEKALIEEDIHYTRIGILTASQDKELIYGENELEEITETIAPPDGDELYKVIS